MVISDQLDVALRLQSARPRDLTVVLENHVVSAAGRSREGKSVIEVELRRVLKIYVVGSRGEIERSAGSDVPNSAEVLKFQVSAVIPVSGKCKMGAAVGRNKAIKG